MKHKMKLYNTLTRSIESVEPIDSGKIKMYTCGLTVYSQPQIGNWVAYIYSDILTRTLIQYGFEVERVQNITDVGHLVSDGDDGEDKMEKGAKQEGLTAWQVADKYIEIADKEAYELLGLLRPSKIVRATLLIEQQVDFVKQLESRGYTYVIDQEGVYFDTSKLASYGDLARLDIEGLESGARVEDKGKRSTTDFALWKFSPNDIKRDMEWDSPWGKGFPGWHLECSAIILNELGESIDIHTGGIDHIPVHHTNEIAQSETLTGAQLSKYWFHNNHMKMNGAKLAKSLGNSYTITDITQKGFSTTAFKLLVMSSHYRTEGNFTWEILEAAQNRLRGFESLSVLRYQSFEHAQRTSTQIEQGINDLESALYNDIDTPKALAVINQVADSCSQGLHSSDIAALELFISKVDVFLGLDIGKVPNINSHQKNMINARASARDNKDWQESDRIRDELKSQGIGVNDLEHGQVWYWL